MSCLHPEPTKRLTALEVLALPYFDDIHELLGGTPLQDSYDAAYVKAVEEGKSSTAHSLWTGCSSCTPRRLKNISLAEIALHPDASVNVDGRDANHLESDPSSETHGCILRHSSSMLAPSVDAVASTSNLQQQPGEREIRRQVSMPSTRGNNNAGGLRRSTTTCDSKSEEMHASFSSVLIAGDTNLSFPNSSDTCSSKDHTTPNETASGQRAPHQGSRVHFSEDHLVQPRAGHGSELFQPRASGSGHSRTSSNGDFQVRKGGRIHKS